MQPTDRQLEETVRMLSRGELLAVNDLGDGRYLHVAPLFFGAKLSIGRYEAWGQYDDQW